MTDARHAKAQLVDAIRMLERAEIIDHNGHCSVRRDAGSFWINSGALVRGALSADDIVATDLDGELLEGEARPPLEFHIHSEIYRRRADVNAVAHTHPNLRDQIEAAAAVSTASFWRVKSRPRKPSPQSGAATSLSRSMCASAEAR